LVEQLRIARPNIAVTTDIIVGFPGETDDDYARTRALVERVQFDNAFVFRYSARRETPAAEMSQQVDEKVKEARNHDLLTVVDASARRAGERLVGQAVEILCEGRSKTNAARLSGRTRGNKIVVFEGDESDVGQLVNLGIVHSTGFSLTGMKGSTAASCQFAAMGELQPPIAANS
jgi:tRNA-2-methylthio-N6-dimethylallyladenosine synthase